MKKILNLLSFVFLTAVLSLGRNTAVFAAEKSDYAENEGVIVTITVDKEEYKAGETVNYSIKIENTKSLWYVARGNLEYKNSDGLISADGAELVTEYEKVSSGESYTITGAIKGDPAVFPIDNAAQDNTENDDTDTSNSLSENNGNNTSSSADSSDDQKTSPGTVVTVIIIFVALAIVIAILIAIKRKKKSNTPTALLMVIVLLAGMLAGFANTGSEKVNAADYEEVILRPYVNFIYGGQEVMIRAIVTTHMYQEKVKISSSDKDIATTTSCHDPSIFKDFDGTYYIFGTHMGLSKSEDLHDWTNMDNSFRASFSQKTIEQIRAYNKDSGTWYGYLWAPDVIYNEKLGKYCMYLSANGDDWQSNIVLLTADSATGPYTYVGSVVYGGFTAANYAETDVYQATGEAEIAQRYLTYGVANKKWGDMYPNCIDPCVFYDDNGNLWMSYGSWSGGIFMLKLDNETGLRDYSYTYETGTHSDAYFGKLIAGGCYVSGEGSYIQKVGDYYFLFISYGNLEANGGYNVRVYRSTEPDGNYVDEKGNTPYYDKYIFNYNHNLGVRLFGGYKWRTFSKGQVAQGHNSAFVDDDGKVYIVYHTRTTDGTEGHYVKVHQMFLNEEGWLVASPYGTNGETLKSDGYSAAEVAGSYDVIIHDLAIDYKNLETNQTICVKLNEDGTLGGDVEGKWSLTSGTAYITLEFGGETYKGVVYKMKVENTSIETMVFTVLGSFNQITVWGSRQF